MKAIISSTYDDKYLYFLPIVTYCWNKLGVDVICFMPETNSQKENRKDKVELINKTVSKFSKGKWILHLEPFKAPEHKEATYAQCSRLYGACLDLPEDEVLVTSDIDMAVFEGIKFFLDSKIDGLYQEVVDVSLVILGSDLVPKNQYPMCYARSTVKGWRKAMNINKRTYQECLDAILGDIECESFRGNYWGKDQETLFLESATYNKIEVLRAAEGTQFATKRYDRDDSFILDRLSPDTIDFHMNRPGYEDKNFEIILTILKYHFPDENFDWLISYTQQYKQLL